MVEDDFDVTKVATLHTNVYRHVLSVLVWSLAEDIVVKFDSAFDDEKYFLCGVILPIKGVILVHLHLTEQRQHLPDKLLTFVV